jgi:hypothetical protein
LAAKKAGIGILVGNKIFEINFRGSHGTPKIQ